MLHGPPPYILTVHGHTVTSIIGGTHGITIPSFTHRRLICTQAVEPFIREAPTFPLLPLLLLLQLLLLPLLLLRPINGPTPIVPSRVGIRIIAARALVPSALDTAVADTL